MLKRILQTFALILAPSFCFATGPGFYLGIMTGPATNNGSTQQLIIKNSNPVTTTPGKPTTRQWGTRIYTGYQMNNYAAFELGFQFFSSIHYDVPEGVQTCSASTRVRDIDLLGKVLFNFSNWFDIYGKGGVAVVYQTNSAAFNMPKNPGTCGKSTYTTKFRPAFSIGASYNINQSWLVDLSANTVIAGNPAGNMSFIALGLSYHFVDVYCGQFLCE